MTETLARFAKDSFYLLRAPISARQKAKLFFNLLYPSQKMLGYDIAHFDRSSLVFLYREIFARQNYYFRAATDSPVIFDCGANVGMATLYFKWLYPNARIHAFEPDPATFAVLEKNVRGNSLCGVVTHNCALWDQDGSIDFYINRMVPGSALMSADASRIKGEPIRVPSRRLSEFVEESVDFLKMDVEGAEYRVLCDLISSGKIGFIKQMVVEYHHRIDSHRSCLAEFLRELEQAGFEYQINTSLYPVTVQNTFQDILIGAYRDVRDSAPIAA